MAATNYSERQNNLSFTIKDTNPVLVREFATDKAYKKSRIYVTGLGLYELYLDGERVGNEYLTPGCTDYNRWIQYQTYEVQIKNGQHRLEVFLADGWYKGRFGLDHAINNYGDRHKMILDLVIPTSGHCAFTLMSQRV